jgi:hypothetical protein
MQNSFSTQPALFITNADLEHASLRGLDDAEAVLGGFHREVQRFQANLI